MIQKVTAYIIRPAGARAELLIFAHRDYPDVPLQVPAGTVDEGEDLEVAARREIAEEAGLVDLRLIRKLGSRTTYRDDLGDYEERHFFLYEPTAPTPETWDHCVTGHGEDTDLIFSYRWADWQIVGELVPILAAYLTPDSVPELFIDSE